MYLPLACLAAIVSSIAGKENLVTWQNAQVEAIRSANPKVGKTLIIGARHKEEYQRSSCYFLTPESDGHTIRYTVIDGLVLDDASQVVDGVEAWDDAGDASVCGLKILSMEDVHDESADVAALGWLVNMEFKHGGILGQINLTTINVEIHLKEDIMKPRLKNIGLAPEHYDLSLIPDLTSTDVVTHFQGKVKISMRMIYQPGWIIPIHMNDMDIKSVNCSVKRSNSTSPIEEALELSNIKFSFQEDLVILLAWDPPLGFNVGDIINTEIEFEARKNHNGIGLYREKCRAHSDKYCWFTQLESTDARYAFPCHDEPGAKATFDIKVARTEGWRTLGNMPVVNSEPVEGMEGWVWDIFQTTPKMSPYLVAFAIQDFGSVSGDNNVTIWATQEHIDAGYAELARMVSPQMISYLENTFGIKFSLPKMDMVSVPHFGDIVGMENWGLIFYDFDYLLYDENNPDDEAKWNVLEIMAHELAHQWFGNLVTMNWWDQLWLNEGFATYLSHLVVANLDPTMNSWDRFVVDKMMSVMRQDAWHSSWAISDPVISTDDIDRKFGDISYSKGGALIRMMESFLGSDTLIKGLSEYLKDMSFMSAVEEDLFTHLESAGLVDGTWPQPGVEDFTTTMKTWTQQAGFPLVTVRKTSEDGRTVVELSQSWYKNGETGSTEQVWNIPITMADIARDDTDWDDTTPDVWLSETKQEIDAAADIIPLLNKKAVGYYRINYSTQIWEKIAEVLQSNHEVIHPLNRAQIICDVINLNKHGYVEKGTMDLVLQYIDVESDFAPIRAHEQCKSGIEINSFKKKAFREKQPLM